MCHIGILQPSVVISQQLIVVDVPRTITTMSSKEKKEFADRMNEVADDLGIPEKGKNRQKSLGTRFHVSQEAARKWLAGEGFPSTEKSIEIAKTAGVNYEWLMTGRGEKKYSSNTIPPEVKEWILKSATNITSVIPTENVVDTPQTTEIKSEAVLQRDQKKGKDSAFRDLKADPLFKPGGSSRADGQKMLNKKEGNK